MEQKSKKIDVKIIIIIIVTIIAIIEGIVIITNKDNKEISKGITEENCVGTWVLADNNDYYCKTMILYKGGTGKALGKGEKEDSQGNVISWEIKDNILNIKIGAGYTLTIGYEVEKNTIKSVDGKYTYYKAK